MVCLRSRIGLLFLFAISGQQALADEPLTFQGKTVTAGSRNWRAKTGKDRRAAVIVLGYFGPAARAAVPDLIEIARQGPIQDEGGEAGLHGLEFWALRNGNLQLRDDAVEALVQIGVGTEVTVPRLIERFIEEGCDRLTEQGTIFFNPDVRDSLVQIGGPAVPALIGVLTGPNAKMRVCAAEALGMIGPAARAAVPALIRALAVDRPASDPPELRGHAAKALGAIGADARGVVPLLNGLLDRIWEKDEGDDINLLDRLIEAFDKLGAPPIERLLKNFLKDGGDTYYLERLGPRAKPAVPGLRSALKDSRAQVRIYAAVALARIDPSVGDAIPVLINALDHPLDNIDYDGVLSALGRLGPTAKAAIPALKRLLGEREDVFSRPGILETLVQVDPSGGESIPALISALRDEDSYVVQAAIDSLGLLGPRAKSAAPPLAALILRNFVDPEPREYDENRAIKTLRRIDADGQFAIPTLIAALRHRDKEPENQEQAALDLDDVDPAETAALLLGSYGPEAKAAIPALVESLMTREKDNANWTVRRAAALALGQIGPVARAAIPVLHDVLNEKPCSIWDGVVIALYQLDPDGKTVAQKWVESPRDSSELYPIHASWGRREIVLGALGRTSLEAHVLTRTSLKLSNYNLAIDSGEEDWEAPRYSRITVEVLRPARRRRPPGHPASGGAAQVPECLGPALGDRDSGESPAGQVVSRAGRRSRYDSASSSDHASRLPVTRA